MHTVNAIHPAPSETVYAAFQGALVGLGRIGGPRVGGKSALNVIHEHAEVDGGRRSGS